MDKHLPIWHGKTDKRPPTQMLRRTAPRWAKKVPLILLLVVVRVVDALHEGLTVGDLVRQGYAKKRLDRLGAKSIRKAHLPVRCGEFQLGSGTTQFVPRSFQTYSGREGLTFFAKVLLYYVRFLELRNA